MTEESLLSEESRLSADELPMDIPEDLQAAYEDGKITRATLHRYSDLAANPLVSPLLRWQGFEERLLADPGFPVKVGIEVGIGIFTKTSAEATKRGAAFTNELDFVFANLLMALVADFCLVWLPAPRVTWRSKSETVLTSFKQSAVFEYVKACPDNCFQKVQPAGQSFSIPQRLSSLAVNGSKLLAVGTVASLVGVGIVNTLIMLRQNLDPAWVPLNPPQNILRTSVAYGVYMAVSSNLRYQIIAGIIEERGIEVWFKNPRVRGACSFVVRTANTFVGSLLWLDFVRLLGMQTAAPH